jgi:hypothetical protein
MIQQGIKKIGIPNILLEKDSPFWANIDYKIRRSGLSMISLDYSTAESHPVNIIERILSTKDDEPCAMYAGHLLLNQKKTKDTHYKLGRAFGYSKESIERFLEYR